MLGDQGTPVPCREGREPLVLQPGDDDDSIEGYDPGVSLDGRHMGYYYIAVGEVVEVVAKAAAAGRGCGSTAPVCAGFGGLWERALGGWIVPWLGQRESRVGSQLGGMGSEYPAAAYQVACEGYKGWRLLNLRLMEVAVLVAGTEGGLEERVLPD